MTTIGIIGVGELGAQLAGAAVKSGYHVVVANSSGPETLAILVRELGPLSRAATASEAARAGDFAIVAVPLQLVNNMPVQELADKVVIDTNNYMSFRDVVFPEVETGLKTEHELRQEELPSSLVAKAFTHLQGPSVFRFARPAGAPDRMALTVSSNYPEAVDVVTNLYDQFGYDTVNNSPLRETWRSMRGTPMWRYHAVGQDRSMLTRNLAAARPRRPSRSRLDLPY